MRDSYLSRLLIYSKIAHFRYQLFLSLNDFIFDNSLSRSFVNSSTFLILNLIFLSSLCDVINKAEDVLSILDAESNEGSCDEFLEHWRVKMLGDQNSGHLDLTHVL